MPPRTWLHNSIQILPHRLSFYKHHEQVSEIRLVKILHFAIKQLTLSPRGTVVGLRLAGFSFPHICFSISSILADDASAGLEDT